MSRQYFFTGTAAPTTTPEFAGSTFTDTTNDRTYLSTGTSSSSDWKLVPNAISEISIDADINMQGVHALLNVESLGFQAPSELTIATGAVTQTQSIHTLDTEADAASDDLDTITVLTNSTFLTVRLADNSRIVTLKHGTGNLNLPGSEDIVMTANALYILMYNGSAWNLVDTKNEAPNNLVIDGQFNFWDNGTSFTADGYGPTMWRFSEGAGAATITRTTFTLGQSDVPDNPIYHLNFNQATGGTNVELSHRIEYVKTSSLKAVTITFYAKVASGTLSVTPEMRQNFGTTGSPSSEVATAGSALTITTTWTKFTQQIIVPTVSGKTLGTDGNDYLELVFKMPDSTTFDLDVANVAVNNGGGICWHMAHCQYREGRS